MDWKQLTHEKAKKIWDKTLFQFSDCNLFQSFGWGEYNKALGLSVYRWVCYRKNGEIAALFQGSLHKYPGVAIILGRGGPVGDISGCMNSLPKKILDDIKVSNCYIRIYPHRSYIAAEESTLLAANWHRPKHTIHTGLSMLLDLTNGREYLNTGLSKNWSRNLKRCNKKKLNIKYWPNPNSNQIYTLILNMAEKKGLDKLWIWPKSENEIEKLLNIFSDKIILYRCLNDSGDNVAIRGCALMGDFALDLFSAAIGEGRNNYATYGLFWELINDCASKGIKYYDMNGIDPVNVMGVYNFKKGTGARPIKYLGAWDWGTSKYLRLFCDWIRFKHLNR